MSSDNEIHVYGKKSGNQSDDEIARVRWLKESALKSKANMLRAKLDRCKILKMKQWLTLSDKKKLGEDWMRDIWSDLSSMRKKFELLMDCTSYVFDRIENLEEQVDNIR